MSPNLRDFHMTDRRAPAAAIEALTAVHRTRFVTRACRQVRPCPKMDP